MVFLFSVLETNVDKKKLKKYYSLERSMFLPEPTEDKRLWQYHHETDRNGQLEQFRTALGGEKIPTWGNGEPEKPFTYPHPVFVISSLPEKEEFFHDEFVWDLEDAAPSDVVFFDSEKFEYGKITASIFSRKENMVWAVYQPDNSGYEESPYFLVEIPMGEKQPELKSYRIDKFEQPSSSRILFKLGFFNGTAQFREEGEGDAGMRCIYSNEIPEVQETLGKYAYPLNEISL